MDLKTSGKPLATVRVASSQDVVVSRIKGKQFAERIGFSPTDVSRIATATTELARNIVQHAKAVGSLTLFELGDDSSRGLGILAEDEGVGIKSSAELLAQCEELKRGGLYGSKQLSHEFSLDSEPDRGTCVQLIRWLA